MKRKYYKIPDYITLEIIEMYINTNFNINDISEKFEISTTTVRDILKKHNIPLKRTNGVKWRKYDVNDNYFEVIDNNEKAYVLGFMYADGYLVVEGKGTKRIGIDSIDSQILLDISKALNFCGEVVQLKNNYSGYGSNKKVYRLKITSPKMYDDLIKLGCFRKKTFDINFPSNEQVPNEFVNSFILGYMDGDGSIIKSTRYGSVYKNNSYDSYSVSFTGTDKFLNGIKKHFNLEKIKLTKRWKNKDDNIFEIRISGNKQVYLFLKELYKDSPLFLQRKKDRFDELDEKYGRS